MTEDKGLETEVTKGEQPDEEGAQQDKEKSTSQKYMRVFLVCVVFVFVAYLMAMRADYRYNIARDKNAREIGEQITWNALVAPAYFDQDEGVRFDCWLYPDNKYEQEVFWVKINTDHGGGFADLVKYARSHGTRVRIWSRKDSTLKDILPSRPDFQEGAIIVTGRAVVVELEYIPDLRSEFRKFLSPRGTYDRLRVLSYRPIQLHEPTSPDD